MRISLQLLLILLPSAVIAQEISITWQHSGQYVEGFKLYTAPAATPTTWTLVKTIPNPTLRTATYNFTSTTPLCFGLSAYNVLEESPKSTTTQGGTQACLGKPQAPTALSFSNQ